MFRISKTFRFAASHQLTALPADHKCARLHGHNYEVTVCLEGPKLTEQEGWLLDYGDMDILKQRINDRFDHRHLNDVLGDEVQPTAEVLAQWIYIVMVPSTWPVRYVEVRETENTMARYYPEPRS